MSLGIMSLCPKSPRIRSKGSLFKELVCLETLLAAEVGLRTSRPNLLP